MNETDLILAAAQTILNKTETTKDSMAIQAVVSIVGMDPDGRKWISHFASTDIRTWEVRGIIEDLRDNIAAGETVRQIHDS